MKAITTRYAGPTNSRGARIIATDEDGNRVTIPYPHELDRDDGHTKAALALCTKMEWSGSLVRGGSKGGYVFVWLSEEEIVTVGSN
jgi:hypothetical protein